MLRNKKRESKIRLNTYTIQSLKVIFPGVGTNEIWVSLSN